MAKKMMARKIISILVEEKTTLLVHMDYGVELPTIYNCIRISTPKDTVEDGMIMDVYPLSRRIKAACLEHRIRTRDVIFTVASSKIANRVVSIPDVSKSKVQSLINVKATENFPIDANKYTFAYASHGDVNEANEEAGVEKSIDYLVFAAPNALLETYYKLANVLKFNVVALDSDGNSVYQIMKRQVESKVVMSIQVNRLGTLVNIMSKDRLLLHRMVPYGIGSVTDAILADKSFQVKNFDEAYNLLITNQVLMEDFETAEDEKDVSRRKRAEVTDTLSFLVNNVNRIVEYYNSRYRDNPIEEIICTGAGASIIGIHELLNHTLDIGTSTPESFLGIKFSKKMQVDRNTLQFVSCFGATFDPVRFVTKDIIEKVETRSSALWTAMVFIASIMLCIALSVISFLQLNDVNSEYKALQEKEAKLISTEVKYEELIKIDNSFEIYKQVASYVNTPNNELHSILVEIAKVSPKNMKVNSIVTTDENVILSVTVSDSMAAISSLKMKLDTIERINNVAIAAITESKNTVTNKREYIFSISFDYKNKYVKTVK